MKYICLGYIEPGTFEGMTKDERHAVLDECFEHNDHLRASGHLVAKVPLPPPETAVTLYWKSDKVATPASRPTSHKGIAAKANEKNYVSGVKKAGIKREAPRCRTRQRIALAAPQGFEPRYADPESAVLPLNEGAVFD